MLWTWTDEVVAPPPISAGRGHDSYLLMMNLAALTVGGCQPPTSDPQLHPEAHRAGTYPMTLPGHVAADDGFREEVAASAEHAHVQAQAILNPAGVYRAMPARSLSAMKLFRRRRAGLAAEEGSRPLKRVYVAIELADTSDFDPTSDDDLDTLAEDVLHLMPGVTSATVYASAADLAADEN